MGPSTSRLVWAQVDPKDNIATKRRERFSPAKPSLRYLIWHDTADTLCNLPLLIAPQTARRRRQHRQRHRQRQRHRYRHRKRQRHRLQGYRKRKRQRVGSSTIAAKRIK